MSRPGAEARRDSGLRPRCAPLRAIVVLMVVSGWPAAGKQSEASDDPFAWFAASVTVDVDDRRRIDRDEVLSRVLPADRGQLALFLASAIRIEPRDFIHKLRQPVQLRQGEQVRRVMRFSVPPRIEDVA